MKSVISACIISLLALSACETVPGTSKPQTTQDIQSQIDQLVRLGDNMRSNGDLTSALGFYRKAYSLDAANSNSIILVAETSKALGDLRGAEQVYASGLGKNANDVEILRRYGNTLLALDKIPQAIIQFNKALALEPGNVTCLNSLGVAYDLQNRHEDAQAQYKTSLTQAPNNLSTLNNYALSLAISGDYDKALSLLQPFENDLAAPKRLRLNLALIYGLQGNATKAGQVAGQILDKESVENNLKVYEQLRQMSVESRKKAVLGK